MGIQTIPPGLVWHTSERSGNNGACVEVAIDGTGAGAKVYVRNSKDRGGAVNIYTAAEWDAFISGVVELGEFRIPA